MTEEWRAVIGYEGWYSVSNLGRVRRDRRGPHTRIGKILRPTIKPSGYAVVTLNRNGVGHVVHIHSLVAKAFLKCRCQVNHKDCDKVNNALENLEYVSPLENIRHSIANGRPSWLSGELARAAKLTASQVDAIRADSRICRVVAKEHGVSRSTISRVRRREVYP